MNNFSGFECFELTFQSQMIKLRIVEKKSHAKMFQTTLGIHHIRAEI